MDVLRAQSWSKFTVLYESIDGLVRVQEILKDPYFRVTLRQLPASLENRLAGKQVDWKTGYFTVVYETIDYRTAGFVGKQVSWKAGYFIVLYETIDVLETPTSG